MTYCAQFSMVLTFHPGGKEETKKLAVALVIHKLRYDIVYRIIIDNSQTVHLIVNHNHHNSPTTYQPSALIFNTCGDIVRSV
jgi:cytidylate kinase